MVVYRAPVPSPTQVRAPQIRLCTMATPSVAIRQGYIGKQEIVINKSRSMSHLYENILAHHSAFQLSGKSRLLIIMEQVLGNAGSLSFPVAPDSHGTVMDMVPAVDHVNLPHAF